MFNFYLRLKAHFIVASALTYKYFYTINVYIYISVIIHESSVTSHIQSHDCVIIHTA